MGNPSGITVDTTNNEIIVANFGGNDSITVYNRTASGDAAPLRTISGLSTELDYPWGIVVDTTNNEIIAANVSDGFNSSITVYNRTASRNLSPIRTIKPALSAPLGINVDKGNNEIFVANAGNFITVFKRAANGDMTQIRTISGSSTALTFPWGIAVDTVNNEIIVSNVPDNSDITLNDYITVYDRTANGNAPPLRTISGTSTGLNGPYGIAIDAVNNEIIVANAWNNSITIYNITANGDTAPIRTISGSSTGLVSPFGITVDTVNNEIYVSNESLPNFDSITVYSRTANGNVAPLRTISGLSTGLYSPRGIAVDTANNVIIVSSTGGNSITIYGRTANGNVPPLRTISGTSTGLNGPWGIALLP